MDATLPLEILHKIFSYFNDALTLIRCRAVCKRWKTAVDGLGDSQWRRVCKNDLMECVYKKVHKKSSIPLGDVYKGVNSWGVRQVKNAEVECRVLPATAKRFKVLPNRMVAVLTNSKGDNVPSDKSLSDTIIYYNVDTAEELKRSHYDKPFLQYDENEHLIVLLSKDRELIMIPKATNQQEIVGEVYNKYDLADGNGGFGLFEKIVFFQNKRSWVCMSKLLETKEEGLIIKTAPLKPFQPEDDVDDEEEEEDRAGNGEEGAGNPEDDEEDDGSFEPIVAYGNMYGILTVLTGYGNVFDYPDDEFCVSCKFIWDSSDILANLQQFGFDWCNPQLYQWFMDRYGDKMKMGKIPHQCFFLHGLIGFLGTSYGPTIHIYNYPKSSPEFPSVDKLKPLRCIDLNKFAELPQNSTNSIYQLDVIESVDHHLVLVLAGEKVVIVKIGLYATETIKSDEDNEPLAKKKTAVHVRPRSKAKNVGKKPKPPNTI